MITLVLGGARSGKSALAERLATESARSTGSSVTYVATMVVGNDAALVKRVALHRKRRPGEWNTVDAGIELPGLLEALPGTVLLDSLGPWLANHENFAADVEGLCAALVGRSGDTIIVSDEVGLGVVPATDIGGAFRDALGVLNQAVAVVADRALLAVAGRSLTLE
ncbi:MAG: bifunctional adenosylcobinamide kinase/adenosylcobinamide-phosphate guanylyltransferase [Nakamurella sp.]